MPQKPQGASANNKAKELRATAAANKQAKARGEKIARGQASSTLNKKAKAWEAGAVGEERVARKLSGISGLDPKKYVVLHDRLLQPDKEWNLDHMVVAPSGLYFLDAKNWKGYLRVNKGSLMRYYYAGPKAGKQTQKMDHEVNKVKAMAAKASQRAQCPIYPVIVLAGKQSRTLEVAMYIHGVYVVGLDNLKTWLESQPQQWDQQSVIQWGEFVKRTFPPASPEAETKAKNSISEQLRNQTGAFKNI